MSNVAEEIRVVDVMHTMVVVWCSASSRPWGEYVNIHQPSLRPQILRLWLNGCLGDIYNTTIMDEEEATHQPSTMVQSNPPL